MPVHTVPVRFIAARMFPFSSKSNERRKPIDPLLVVAQNSFMGSSGIRICASRTRRLRLGLGTLCCLLLFSARAQQKSSDGRPFRDEAAAHALYTRMFETLRRAE